MPLDPTLDELVGQPSPAPQPQGLPPPQPTPSWYSRGVEHQQRWGLPGAGGQLSDLATRAAGGVQQGWNWLDKRAQTAMTGDVDEESIKATTDLASLFMGGGMAGAETGAAGVAGGRLFLRNLPHMATSNYKNLELIDESGKVIGNVSASRLNNKDLYVGWTGAGKGPWAAGTSEMLSFMSELQHEFPGIEKIKALRVSGARRGAASSGEGGAREITIPKHRRIAPGTPRDAPPEPGTINPITEERNQQWQQRNPYERMFTARTRGQNVPATEPAAERAAATARSADRPPERDEMARRHLNEYATQQQSNETWDQMRQRQDAEWNALMQRLFGNR